MDERINKIQKEISLIKDRNNRVEVDKAWETSRVRAFSILFLTYICASIVMFFIGVNDYLVNALIPTLGFFLSIQSLPFVKRWWIKKYSSNSHTL